MNRAQRRRLERQQTPQPHTHRAADGSVHVVEPMLIESCPEEHGQWERTTYRLTDAGRTLFREHVEGARERAAVDSLLSSGYFIRVLQTLCDAHTDDLWYTYLRVEDQVRDAPDGPWVTVEL